MSQNRRLYVKSGVRTTNTSGFTGVTKSGDRWKASLMVKGKSKYLGRFETIDEAHNAYETAKKQGKALFDSDDKKRKRQSNNSSGYTGVSKNKRRFKAEIRIKGKRTHLGTFDTTREAAIAYDRAATESGVHGIQLNFPRLIHDLRIKPKPIKRQPPRTKKIKEFPSLPLY